jgi:hypothetical protein
MSLLLNVISFVGEFRKPSEMHFLANVQIHSDTVLPARPRAFSHDHTRTVSGVVVWWWWSGGVVWWLGV